MDKLIPWWKGWSAWLRKDNVALVMIQKSDLPDQIPSIGGSLFWSAEELGGFGDSKWARLVNWANDDFTVWLFTCVTFC